MGISKVWRCDRCGDAVCEEDCQVGRRKAHGFHHITLNRIDDSSGEETIRYNILCEDCGGKLNGVMESFLLAGG